MAEMLIAGIYYGFDACSENENVLQMYSIGRQVIGNVILHYVCTTKYLLEKENVMILKANRWQIELNLEARPSLCMYKNQGHEGSCTMLLSCKLMGGEEQAPSPQ